MTAMAFSFTGCESPALFVIATGMSQAASGKDAGERRECREYAHSQRLILRVITGCQMQNKRNGLPGAPVPAPPGLRYLSFRSKVTSLRESKELMVLTALLDLPRSAHTS